MRRCTAIDLPDRSIPRPDNRSGDVQAFAARELCQAVVAELESLRRLVRSAEQCDEQGRVRTLARLLTAIDEGIVGAIICADDAADLCEQIARSMRTLTLNARIEAEWQQAQTRRAS